MSGSDFMIFFRERVAYQSMLEDNRDIKTICKQSLTDGRIEKT